MKRTPAGTTTKRIRLAYGGGSLAFSLDASWTVRAAARAAAMKDPVGAMERALESPIGGPPLRELAAGKRAVVISIPDATRPFPSGTFLGPLVRALEEAGVPRSGIRAIVATGVHRPMSPGEIRLALGPAADMIGGANHDHKAGLVELGTTRRCTPVQVNAALQQADLAISLGSVAFHFHAGFGGGRKGLVPGLAGQETARRNHLLALSGPSDTWHPGCGPGLLDGNPVHEDLLEAARMVRPPVFLVNFVPATRSGFCSVKAGDLEQAHVAACAELRSRFAGRVDDPFDVALVSAGGAPRDVNLIQAHKAAAHAAGALREGGTLVLVAECPEGWGHDDLPGWFGVPMPRMRSLSEETGRKYVQTAYSFQEKAKRFDFLVLSSLSEEPLRRSGLIPVRGPEEIRAFLLAKHGPDFRGIAVPDSSVLLQAARPSRV